ncbi:3-dehydroquinate synthase [Gilvimarinus agarilyticus]|uniref:3-dehydroquinate synthase n=1 Tax=Reichenbachiella agariperforans TaxID=156994 RepID=A0A1M6R1P2_REIAG|nr:3-dehydroquinate synthase [Reichenbachiella agariperforans]MBU2884553.1 3-dehydroquinate synthase [Gilvimarinus agarilyticus]MBU2912786.1 3-dehydroquinate synthase [Reichenbachiella agariperforans]SHK26405.1 3-dehydroquinate synthase [Reichenbachiella agariperforans]
MENHNTEVTTNIQESITRFLASRKYSKIAVLVDENTEAHCLPKILDALPDHYLITIPSGESNKNLSTCEDIWMALTEAGFDRKGLMINLGGGVIGDMGGFVASTYKRGFEFLNIPTTLLSQVDASVGGKLGVDFHGFKNHIGIFNEPQNVLIYTDFYSTLPKEEVRSGFAEVIKHGLIYDAAYWEQVKTIDPYRHDWTEVVSHSIDIKKKVVTEDPFESGLRKILNFGHTIGHAIESYFLEIPGERLLHGEAIAVGMITEAYLSHKLTGLSKESLEEITDFLIKVYAPKKIDAKLFEEILGLTTQDKKNEGGIVQFSLLKEIGSCTINIPIGIPDMIDSLFYLNERIG